MHFKKLISLWVLLTLMLGQLALAEHSAIHIDHDFSQEITVSYEQHDNHYHGDCGHQEKNEQHQCLECVLATSLQAAFYNSPITLSATSHVEDLLPIQQSFTVVVSHDKANVPRAPPSILI